MSAMIMINDANEARIGQALREISGGSKPPGYMSATGVGLRPCVEDSGEGVKIAEGIRSRGRRWCVADDVEWSSTAAIEFRGMRDGAIARSERATKTGVDLRQFGSLKEFRAAMVDGDAEKLALSITPATSDEAPSLFLASELTLMLPDIIKVERVMPYARTVLPMRFLNAPGASYYRFNVIDDYGDAQWTSNFDGTPPVIGGDRQVITRPLEYLWMMARWGLRELMEWQQARSNGVTLPDFARERPRSAREALLRQENYWLFFGGPTGSKILGLLSAPTGNPTVSTQGIEITNSPNWANLTAEGNVKLIADAIVRITIDGVEVPNTILMGLAQYTYLATTQWPNTEKMLLGVLLENLKPMGITDIVAVPEMTYRAALETKLLAKKYDTATARRYAGGLNGKDVMVVLSKNPAKVAGIVNQDVRSLAPEVRPAETSVIQILGSGGTEVRYPKAHQIVTFDAYDPGP